MSEGFSLFGFEIRRRPIPDSQKSFVPEQKDDGAVVVSAGGAYGSFVDLEGTVRTEAELVSKYRELALQPEIDKAINEITNEAIVNEDGKETVEIILDDMPEEAGNEKLKNIITNEFKNIIDILNFKKNSYDTFKRWYIDGRGNWHVVIDEKAPNEGIKELRYIDPRKIRKIREVVKVKDPKSGAVIQKIKKEYFLYNDKGLNVGSRYVEQTTNTTGIKIQPDSIIQVTSGLLDKNNTMVLSYLHPSIKPMNQLRALEDATIIYHLSRAPERRIFYIDVGNLPKIKAEQYVREMMTRYKNKLAYNAATGEIRDDRKFMTMNEDFWLPRREGNRGTEIDTISGGTALPDLLQTVEYFEDKLYRALQVPLSRLKPDTVYSLGRATEISRDEVNFTKFIDRIRNKFSDLFLIALEKQLILKGLFVQEDWDQVKKYIRFRYLRDVYTSELKDLEILGERINRVRDFDDYAGKYVSHVWIRKNILKQNDEDLEQMDMEIQQEFESPQYNQMIMQAEVENMTNPDQGQQGKSNDNQKPNRSNSRRKAS